MKPQEKSPLRLITILGAGLCAVIFVSACSSDQPKPLAQPTPDQVRGHADKVFDKLKQEEQERAAQQNMSR